MLSTFSALLAAHPELSVEIRWYLKMLESDADEALIRVRAESLDALAGKLGLKVTG